MNKLFISFAILGCVTTSHAQITAKVIGENFEVSGNSVEVRNVEEECHRPKVEGTCKVTVSYQSDVFPVHFIQGSDTLETVWSQDSAIGWEAVQGVKYELLPNGVPTYLMEVRNGRGGTFVWTDIPKQ